jgi:hypothetical protein
LQTVAYAIARDSLDNVYVSGSTNGGLDGNSLTGTIDFYITKYNSAGVKQWTQQLGVASASTVSRGVTVDTQNNIYIGGYTNGGLDGNTWAGYNWDHFVTKYNSAGVKQWTKQLGTNGVTQGWAITTDQLDNVFITGNTSGDLDGNTLIGSDDFFVTKYNPAGVKQ